jgi:hypothetical protein
VEEFSWKSEEFQWSVHSEEDVSVSDSGFANCCDQFYEGLMNSVIKSKTLNVSHANPGYVIICFYIHLCFSVVLSLHWPMFISGSNHTVLCAGVSCKNYAKIID